MNLFEYIYPRFYFKKTDKIRLFEAFSGVGCQAMALKRITDNYELVGFSEIDKYAIQSYKAIHGEVKNYGDITKMEKIPECDIFTWSFPCQDLSKAGKQKGLDGTRSGLVYEVLRLLHNTEKKPKVLIMENVSALISATFVNQFNEIQLELEQLGYKNYNEVLNAKDYGIPQNRERIFMVSILGDYSYTFPEPIKLELRLKDLLENEVDEKYYLSDKMINFFANNSRKQKENGNGFSFKPIKDLGKSTAKAITTRSGSRMDDNFIVGQTPHIAIKEDTFVNKKYKDFYEKKGYVPDIFNPYNNIEIENVAPTITTQSGSTTTSSTVLIKEATTKGYAEAHDGDGIYINRPEQKRGVVQKGMIQTIKTSVNDVAVVVEDKPYSDYSLGKIKTNLRIRKLTPLECWRLMGISDTDFDKAQASGMSNAQLYKQAGNGIVVNVFEAILRELFKENKNELHTTRN